MAVNRAISITFSNAQFGYLQSESDRRGIAVAQLVRECVGKAVPGFDAPERNVRTKMPWRPWESHEAE